MPKDKQGNKITWKEFMSRWKQGIEGITPLQQIQGQIYSTLVMVLGLLCGIVMCLFDFSKLWWVEIILLAGMGNTIFQFVGLWQKKQMLKKFDVNIQEVLKGGLNGI